MTTPFFVPGVPPGTELRDLETLETLVADLRAYADGRMPSASDLRVAPLISHWHPVRDRSSCRLAGEITGHPLVGPGPGISSRIYAVDREHRWIRSYSRLWRLGPPAT